MRPTITCPVCRSVSPNPNDIANGYCGRCHAFTGLSGDTAGAGRLATVLQPALDELSPPPILPDDPVSAGVREMFSKSLTELLNHDRSVFYTESGDPIDLPPVEAVRAITEARAKEGREVSDTLTSADGVPLWVTTVYMGVDFSTGWALPLTWETIVFVGDNEAGRLFGPWRYSTMRAAHAGHALVLETTRKAVSS